MTSVDQLSSALGGLDPLAGASSPLATAQEPENIRNGGAKAQQAYETGLAFEQVLVNELAQQMTSTIDGSDDGSDDGSSDGSSDGSGGLLGSGPAASEISQLLPTTLTSSIMDGGGLGNLADSIAASIDPAINDPSGATGSSS